VGLLAPFSGYLDLGRAPVPDEISVCGYDYRLPLIQEVSNVNALSLEILRYQSVKTVFRILEDHGGLGQFFEHQLVTITGLKRTLAEVLVCEEIPPP
jgi:hypothetical protein